MRKADAITSRLCAVVIPAISSIHDDEIRASKKGDERELGNKRRRPRLNHLTVRAAAGEQA